MGVKLMQAQASYEGANVLTKEQWGRAQDWAYKGINPASESKTKAKSTETVTPASTTTPTIHYQPKVEVHVHGAPTTHDYNSVKEAVKNALSESHGHLRRTLQEMYRDEQRTSYA